MWHQRRFCKRARYREYKNSCKAHEYTYLIPVDMPVCAQRPWHDHLEVIQPVTEYDDHRHESDRKIITLTWTRHQYKDRHTEVDNEVGIEYNAVWTLLAHFEVNCFIRDIRIPDQHVLCKPKICPENTECKHELTKVMYVFNSYQLKVTLVFKIYNP